MKRRKNIIISAITCMFSICLMMFGVYAAASPTITLNGQVSYTVRDAKVLVLGKVNGQSGEDQTNKITYPTVADMTNPTVSEKVTESTTQYMSFTKGDGNSEADQLDTWNLSTHTFYEDNTGIRPITISMKLSNLSNYPVLATVAYTVSDATLATSNLTRTTTGLSESTVYLPMSSTKEISITYDVLDDSTSVSGTNLVGMTVTFAKTVEPTASNAYYTNAEGTSQELTLSDWEYVFEGDSFTITKYKGTLQAGDLYIPSSITDTNGKSYPVKALGAVDMTLEELMDSGDESDWFGYSILHDKDTVSALLTGGLSPVKAYIATLPTVIVPEGIEKINTCALISTPIQSLPTSIKRVGVLGVGDYVAEFGITVIEIETLNLPNVETIDYGAFYFNTNLTSVTLRDKLESIGDWAFAYCTGLTSVIIPSSVKSIGEDAFAACSSLTIVQVDGTTPCECGEDIFGGVSNLASGFTIYVPNESYKTATNWETYKEYMVVGTAPAQPVVIGDWRVELNETDNTATIIKYVGNLNKETLTIPATLSYEGETYNVKSVGNAYSETDNFLVFHKKSGEAASYSDGQAIYFVLLYIAGLYDTDEFAEKGIVLPKFKNVVVQEGIEYIGAGLFAGCTTLQSLTIPTSVTNMDTSFFALGCNLLTSIVLPSDITSIDTYAFALTGLTSVSIPSNVTSIGSNAFSGCSGLTSIIIPSSVESIGDGAFSGCSGLTNITIHSGVTSIGDHAFKSCTGLTSVTIPSSVTSIGDKAFDECYHLAEVINLSSLSITAGSSSNGYVGCYAVRVADSGTSQIQTSGDYKFVVGNDESNYLIEYFGTDTSLTLPTNESYKIKNYAFYECENLTSVTIPSNVTSIGISAFYKCYHLAEVINLSTSFSITAGSESNGYVGYYAVRVATSGESAITTTSDGYKFVVGNDNSNYLIGYFGEDTTSLTLPINGDYKIKQYAFAENNTITSVIFADGITAVGEGAFKDCYKLENITISNTVTRIENWAFENINYTAVLEIPDSVEYLGECFVCGNYYIDGHWTVEKVVVGTGVKDFGNYIVCENLVLHATTPPSTTEDEFYIGCVSGKTLKIYVPDDCVDAYKAADGWSKYASNIKPLSELPA